MDIVGNSIIMCKYTPNLKIISKGMCAARAFSKSKMGKKSKIPAPGCEKGGSKKRKLRARDSANIDDFVEPPNFPELRAKNVAAAKARSVNKLVRTQTNKWLAMGFDEPSLDNMTDVNMANYTAKVFDEHPNPSQRKSTLSFLKHTSTRLGMEQVMLRMP
jgi:hypothetical protein